MANTEIGRTANTDFLRFVARKSIVGILSSMVLRYETIDENGCLARADKLSKEGCAIIAAYTHPSAGEPPRVAEILTHEKVMGHKKIITPIAQHQGKSLYRWLGKIIDVTFESIATDNSMKKDGNTIASKGKKEYLKKTADGIKKGEIILLAPQQERLPYLGQPKRAVRAIMGSAEEEGYENYAFLIIGFEIKGTDDYSTKKARGLNPFKKYTANVGSCLTRKEVLARATIKARGAWKNTEIEMPLKFVLKFVDEVIFEELRKVVPPNYIEKAASET